MDGKILVLPGDGIGVEVTDQSLKILTAVSKKHNRSFTIEKDILIARRLSDDVVTLEELSKKYKVSRERIRQIETTAFEKLQKTMLNSAKSINLLPKN